MSREFQGSSIIPFFSRLSPEGWGGYVTLVLAVLCTKLCAGKVRTVRFPKAYLFIMRDSDVRTVLSIWVSFSVSRIVSLYVFFRWLEKWDIAGSAITLAGYCLSTCSPWPPPLALVQSLGVRRQINLGPRIRRARGVRLTILDSCISKYLLISCDL